MTHHALYFLHNNEMMCVPNWWKQRVYVTLLTAVKCEINMMLPQMWLLLEIHIVFLRDLFREKQNHFYNDMLLFYSMGFSEQLKMFQDH